MRAKISIKSYIRRVIGEDMVRSLREKQRQWGLIESGPFVSHVAAEIWPSMFEPWHRRRTFQDAYQNNRWGSASGEKFFSGLGSRGQAVETYVARISDRITQHQRELGRDIVVVDLGCGDFSVGRELLERTPNMTYIGCDLVPELIAHHRSHALHSNATFQRVDIVTDPLPEGDIVLVRQVLQHLSNDNVRKVLDKLKIYDRIYVTEGQPVYRQGPPNPDKPIGSGMRFDWRTGRGRGLELDKPPFNLKTDEVCRAQSTDVEVVITERLLL
jgi:SAM-dependent methyltransferase